MFKWSVNRRNVVEVHFRTIRYMSICKCKISLLKGLICTFNYLSGRQKRNVTWSYFHCVTGWLPLKALKSIMGVFQKSGIQVSFELKHWQVFFLPFSHIFVFGFDVGTRLGWLYLFTHSTWLAIRMDSNCSIIVFHLCERTCPSMISKLKNW